MTLLLRAETNVAQVVLERLRPPRTSIRSRCPGPRKPPASDVLCRTQPATVSDEIIEAICAAPRKTAAHIAGWQQCYSRAGSAVERKEDLAMCYEESFFLKWARKRAERRHESEAAIERSTPKEPTRPTPAPATATDPNKSKQRERETELV